MRYVGRSSRLVRLVDQICQQKFGRGYVKERGYEEEVMKKRLWILSVKPSLSE